MTPCFCIGPQKGEKLCPCQLRDKRTFEIIGPITESVTVHVGWKCPVCGKGNAPFARTCGNAACGIDFSKGASA